MKKNNSFVQSVDRAIQILDSFTMNEVELSIAELSEKTGLTKSTVYRLVSTLVKNNYLEQDPQTQKYRLGFRLFNLGSIVVNHMSLKRVALPYMKQLCDKTSETISLNIIEQGCRVCIEMLESHEVVRNIIRVGQRNELWVGASGKVLLAFLDPEEQKEILQRGLEAGKLLPEYEELLAELSDIRRQGYSKTIDERVKGTFSMSAPIFDYTNKLAGGITVAGPLQRLSTDRSDVIIEYLVTTAKKISRAMGYMEA